MRITFSVYPEMGKDFLENLKSLFPKHKVEIQAEEADARDYIKSSPENVKRLSVP